MVRMISSILIAHMVSIMNMTEVTKPDNVQEAAPDGARTINHIDRMETIGSAGLAGPSGVAARVVASTQIIKIIPLQWLYKPRLRTIYKRAPVLCRGRRATASTPALNGCREYTEYSRCIGGYEATYTRSITDL